MIYVNAHNPIPGHEISYEKIRASTGSATRSCAPRPAYTCAVGGGLDWQKSPARISVCLGPVARGRRDFGIPAGSGVLDDPSGTSRGGNGCPQSP